MSSSRIRFVRPLLCSIGVLTCSTACTMAEIMQMQQQRAAPPLVSKVWFDTGCPQYDIKVLSWTEDLRAAQVNACGRIRRYQDVSGREQDPNWLDTTTLVEGGAPMQEAPAPAPTSSSAAPRGGPPST